MRGDITTNQIRYRGGGGKVSGNNMREAKANDCSSEFYGMCDNIMLCDECGPVNTCVSCDKTACVRSVSNSVCRA